MKENAKERNYWPHGIVISIILVVIACAWTIKIAIENPVQMDSYYMEKYQDVDKNMHTIEEKQKLFFERFDIVYTHSKIVVGQPFSLNLSIKDKTKGVNLEEADVKLLITRPDTNDFNQKFSFLKAINSQFEAKNIVLNKPGRWQFLAKIKYKEYEGFHKYEALAIQ